MTKTIRLLDSALVFLTVLPHVNCSVAFAFIHGIMAGNRG